ncbi:MAG: 2-C-methyl-D-erythritol 4-phosphate cytidylyltransferase [Candidatus Eremiobacteraeota bacterium]|nr:2-C-methyl-D-erythritol 4-phosphate cytidylyltransferase [Candidatus Eremiobacteraeota bacterium]
MSWGAIVVAAGRGTRFGRPKQLVPLAGKPMLAWSLELFGAMHEIATVVVATEPELVSEVGALVPGVRVVAGGAERQDSVRLALAELPERCERVLVHDGARPLVRADDVRRGMEVVEPHVCALLAVPVVDTIKQVDEGGKVVRTLDRARLWHAQTPQFAMSADLRRAHRDAFKNGVRVTDDATLLERAGFDVLAIEGSAENFKVTVPADLLRAEVILRERLAAS